MRATLAHEVSGFSPQVSDFLSGRSPLTLALRVGDHMMFVQLQLAAQHAPLQHRHVLAAAAAAAAAARGDSSVAAPVSSPCRPVSSAARVPPVSSSPSSPVSPSPVTAGSFRSHAASTTCPEVRMQRLKQGKGFEGSSCSLVSGAAVLIQHIWNLGQSVTLTALDAGEI